MKQFVSGTRYFGRTSMCTLTTDCLKILYNRKKQLQAVHMYESVKRTYCERMYKISVLSYNVNCIIFIFIIRLRAGVQKTNGSFEP